MSRFIAAALCGGIFFGQIAQGEPPCGERNRITAMLRGHYVEALAGNGLTPEGGLIELFTSEIGSFIILVTTPSGLSRIVAAGADWNWDNARRHGKLTPGIAR